MRTSSVRRVLAGSIVTLICWAGTASAQGAPPSPAPPASAGPLVLEPMHNGFVLAPEVKFTKVDHEVSPLVGAYAGWIYDDHLLLGGGGYWLAHHSHNIPSLGYGGFVIGWFFNPEQRFSVSTDTIMKTPCISPNAAYVQLAPCHTPIATMLVRMASERPSWP